ncbi:serine hydrolase [Rhizobium sp. KVB221]|uniref:Serine hydrolase n=1 Tax=Rhizobium setariae TaxID=2801340 RepID=A0A936YQN5_9HYPH|nr:serine hydrolase [Rhizobium setariae]MBL0370797.1 serine hydrolase [Rhizobium setariae]
MTGDHTYRDPKNPGAPVIPRAEWDIGPYNRYTFQNVRDFVPTTRVWRGTGAVSPLAEAHQDLSAIRFSHDGTERTIGTFLDETFTDGLLIMHGGKIVSETYMNGMRPETLHLSQSVGKSVVGALAGIIVGRGLLDPQAAVTAYLPELEKTAYRGATMQQVLDMTTGTTFDETYTAPDSHVAKLDAACGWKERKSVNWPQTVWQLILELSEAERPHGAAFQYRSIETDVLAFILQRVTGKMLAELVSEEIWMPMGAEHDASFTVDPAGYALACGGFNASLRDYGRFAAMIAAGGTFNGRQIVPAAWVAETRSGGNHAVFGSDYRFVLPNGAYHNQFWVEDVDRPVLMSRGVFGQLLYMDQDADFIAVKLSTWPDFINAKRTKLTLAAIHAIRNAVLAR